MSVSEGTVHSTGEESLKAKNTVRREIQNTKAREKKVRGRKDLHRLFLQILLLF
jgi:hypothetical protein